MSLRELLDRFDEAVPGVSPEAAPGTPKHQAVRGFESSVSGVPGDSENQRTPRAISHPSGVSPALTPASSPPPRKAPGTPGTPGTASNYNWLAPGSKFQPPGTPGTGICEHCMHFERDPGTRRLHRCGLGGLCLTQRQSGECGPSGALWARKQHERARSRSGHSMTWGAWPPHRWVLVLHGCRAGEGSPGKLQSGPA
jgi:hypothetical protein